MGQNQGQNKRMHTKAAEMGVRKPILNLKAAQGGSVNFVTLADTFLSSKMLCHRPQDFTSIIFLKGHNIKPPLK